MKYARMAIEAESPEQFGYGRIKNNLTETYVCDRSLRDLGVEFNDLLLSRGDHADGARLSELIARQSGLASQIRCSSRPSAVSTSVGEALV